MKKSPSSKNSETDWERIDKLPEEEIDLTDIPEIDPRDFAKAVVRQGLKPTERKAQITLRIDSDVIRWFKSLGRGYQTRINELLRAYMEAHK